MKAAAFFLFFIFNGSPELPTGVWIYQEDFSRIEISEIKGKLSGKLISTRNPNSTPGTEVLKEFIYIDGKWQGRLYLASKERWVEASLVQKENLLFLDLDFGYDTKRIHWYKDKTRN